MKVIKYIAQIIASLLYSGILSWILLMAIILPTTFFFSLPWWGMLLAIFVFGGIVEGLISIIVSLATIPCIWIVKNNTVALVISLLIIIGDFIMGVIKLWQFDFSGFWQTLLLIIMTLEIIRVGFAIIPALISLRLSDDE